MTTKLEKRLDDLDQVLDAVGEDTMLLSELDGFLTGILLCPDRIQPSDWLPLVWGEPEDGEAPAPARGVLDDAFDAVMAHHDALADTLNKRSRSYEPVLEVDPDTGDIVWQTWALGFYAAFSLQPDAWLRIIEDPDSAASAALALVMALFALAEDAPDDAELTQDQVDRLTVEAPTLIPELVATLAAWRKAHAPTAAPALDSAPKAGRNDPCPCGSGRKYKKCCGLN